MSGSEALDDFVVSSRQRVDAALDAALPPETEPPAELHRAMRYAVFSGGKRLRPALAFGAAMAAGVDPDQASPVAGAVELAHACSLVLDDLPALDDDDERRGRPTVHVAFGHALAILAGNALLAAAFAQCARLSDPGTAVAAVSGLARAVGPRGIIGGQVDDLAFAAEGTSVEHVTSIHQRKTAAMFRFATRTGGLVGRLEAERLDGLDRFGRAYGLAFQLVDDLLDADADECSILRVLPPERVRARILDLLVEAIREMEPFGARGWALVGLARRLRERLPQEPA